MTSGPVFTGLSGAELSIEERDLLLHPQVGGVVLFKRNYVDPEQLEALTGTLHALREDLIIAVDQEGGRVQRLDNGFTPLPAAGMLGDLYRDDPEHALEMAGICAWVMAKELHGVGIDISFSPVCDLNRDMGTIIGDRAFHSDPDIVGSMAAAWRHGMGLAGMPATIKHFPGHGGVVADSHLELPQDDRALADIELEDMRPFEHLVSCGAEAVMMAHILFSQIDEAPAGFSRFWIQEMLRRKLDFQGVVFSDDLDMAGASWAGPLEARVRVALDAGCDAVLVCQSLEAIPNLLDELGEQTNPVSRMRLSRLRGQRHWSRRRSMLLDPEWQQKRDQVIACLKPYTTELPLFDP